MHTVQWTHRTQYTIMCLLVRLSRSMCFNVIFHVIHNTYCNGRTQIVKLFACKLRSYIGWTLFYDTTVYIYTVLVSQSVRLAIYHSSTSKTTDLDEL